MSSRRRSVEFYRVEDYSPRIYPNSVLLSFETERFGFFQIEYNGDDGLCEIKQEPSLEMFRSVDREYIEHICAIVYRLIHRGRAP